MLPRRVAFKELESKAQDIVNVLGLVNCDEDDHQPVVEKLREFHDEFGAVLEDLKRILKDPILEEMELEERAA